MNTFEKSIATAVLVGIVLCILFGLFKALGANYVEYASPVSLFIIALGSIGVGYLCFKGIRNIWINAMLLALLFAMPSCSRVKSNQQVLVSQDCGMSWESIPSGDAVPRGVGNTCYMRVTIPNYPMQGEASFVANLKARVRVVTHIDYDYSIDGPLQFIREAKTLGNTNADTDSVVDPAAFESAENRVIDKRIRDVAKELFLDQDIIELNQADLEDTLLEECNKRLKPLGVRLNFMTLTFDTDEQTRQAIDVSTAMKIYESKGLKVIGERVMEARAGATKVTVENVVPKQNEIKE